MRVCLISHQYPPALIGGIGRFTADLAAGFAAAGHDVHVLSSQGGVRGTTLEQHVWVHRIPNFPALPDALKHEQAGLYLSRLASVYREVMRLHEEKSFDIISSPIYLAEGLLIAKDPRFAAILSLHTSSNWRPASAASRPLANSPLAILENHCVHAHSHTHANSHAAVQTITAEYATPNSVFVIPHGVNDMSLRYARDRGDDSRIRVLLVGLMDKRKGADVLYDIIPKILSRFSTVEFVLLGPPFPMAEFGYETLPLAMQRRFRKRPDMLRRVHFAGVVPDDEVYRSYANADLLLLPSRYESFGLSVIEAMSFGLPVVAWKAGGVCETVVDGESGILVDVENRNGLIEAVGRLATDPQLRRRYGDQGRKRYLSHFSTTTSIPRTIDAYRKIAEAEASVGRGRFYQPDAVVAQFAKVIATVTALKEKAALATAQSLIDGCGSSAPRVGVVVNCFNAAEGVAATLDSVRAQTFRDFHCVVIDDASSDRSADVIASWIADKRDGRFSVQRHEARCGSVASISAGLVACDGELVALLDAGEVWLSDFLQLHVSVINETSIAVSRSVAAQADHQAQISGGQPPVRFEPPNHVPYSADTASCMMFQRSFLEAAMPLDATDPAIRAQAYFFTLGRYISGAFAIEQSPVAFRDRPAGATRASEQADIIVARAAIRHLLDYPPKLAAVLPARRRDILLRTLLRQCLRAGVSVDDQRIYEVLGLRVWRDRLRARVWFLRRGLA